MKIIEDYEGAKEALRKKRLSKKESQEESGGQIKKIPKKEVIKTRKRHQDRKAKQNLLKQAAEKEQIIKALESNDFSGFNPGGSEGSAPSLPSKSEPRAEGNKSHLEDVARADNDPEHKEIPKEADDYNEGVNKTIPTHEQEEIQKESAEAEEEADIETNATRPDVASNEREKEASDNVGEVSKAIVRKELAEEHGGSDDSKFTLELVRLKAHGRDMVLPMIRAGEPINGEVFVSASGSVPSLVLGDQSVEIPVEWLHCLLDWSEDITDYDKDFGISIKDGVIEDVVTPEFSKRTISRAVVIVEGNEPETIEIKFRD